MAPPWEKKGEASLSVPLLRAEGGEEEAEVGLETTENGCAPTSKAVVLPLDCLVDEWSSGPEEDKGGWRFFSNRHRQRKPFSRL